MEYFQVSTSIISNIFLSCDIVKLCILMSIFSPNLDTNPIMQWLGHLSVLKNIKQILSALRKC